MAKKEVLEVLDSREAGDRVQDASQNSWGSLNCFVAVRFLDPTEGAAVLEIGTD
jgi:hypothetical protein